MPKGYLVANIRVQDKEKFAAFSGMAAPVIKAHGGKVLARGHSALKWDASTNIIFASASRSSGNVPTGE